MCGVSLSICHRQAVWLLHAFAHCCINDWKIAEVSSTLKDNERVPCVIHKNATIILMRWQPWTQHLHSFGIRCQVNGCYVPDVSSVSGGLICDNKQHSMPPPTDFKPLDHLRVLTVIIVTYINCEPLVSWTLSIVFNVNKI
jgi:hypothetical protein